MIKLIEGKEYLVIDEDGDEGVLTYLEPNIFINHGGRHDHYRTGVEIKQDQYEIIPLQQIEEDEESTLEKLEEALDREYLHLSRQDIIYLLAKAGLTLPDDKEIFCTVEDSDCQPVLEINW